MFAYCENNPVIAADQEGKLFDWVCAAIGGAVGALVAGASCIINSGGDASFGEVLAAAGVGFVSGAAAAGGPTGIVVASVVTGVYTAITTEGSFGEKVAAGCLAAGFTALGGVMASQYVSMLEPCVHDLGYYYGYGILNFVYGGLAELDNMLIKKAYHTISDNAHSNNQNSPNAVSKPVNNNYTVVRSSTVHSVYRSSRINLMRGYCSAEIA